MKFHILTGTLNYFTLDAKEVTVSDALAEILERDETPTDALLKAWAENPNGVWWPATLAHARIICEGCRVFTEYQWAEYVESAQAV